MQNSTIKVYLQIFINYKQDNWAKLCFIVEFVYNNTKDTNTNYTLFELNYNFYPQAFYKNDINLCF